MRLRFGDCVFDTEMREIVRNEQRRPLPPKALLMLETLLACRPRPMSKQDLQERLWPDTYVIETNLARLVAELRGWIGDDAHEGRFIRTIHRYGYAFVGEVSEEPEPARAGRLYRLVWQGREIPLGPGDTVLGRDADCEVTLASTTVSRRHARIRVTPEGALIEDLRSKNGTFVGSLRLAAPHRLQDGDEIRIGFARMVFRALPAVGTTQTDLGS